LDLESFFPVPPEKSYPSGTPVTDGHLSFLDDDGDFPTPPGFYHHLLDQGTILPHVAEIDLKPLVFVGLPGLIGIGSTGFSVDDDSAHLYLQESGENPDGATARPTFNAQRIFACLMFNVYCLTWEKTSNFKLSDSQT